MDYIYFERHHQESFYQDRKNYLIRFHECYLKYYTSMIRSLKFQKFTI